jgi:hypothetical protein
MLSVYGTTFAHVSEIARGMLVRRLAGFHVVVDIKAVEDTGTRLWLSDGKHYHARSGRLGRGTALSRAWPTYKRRTVVVSAASRFAFPRKIAKHFLA